MSQRNPFTPRRRRSDLWTLAIAAALLCGLGLWWTSLSHHAIVQKKEVLSHVPAFPTRGQTPREKARPAPAPIVAMAPAPAVDGGVAPPPGKEQMPATDVVKRFLMNADPKGMVMTMHLNSLMNAPIIDKLDKCFPKKELKEAAVETGVDYTRDIDQIAATDKGMMFTGFFSADDARSVAGCPYTAGEPRTYRGFTIYGCADGSPSVAVQSSVALRPEKDATAEELIDQVLAAPPESAKADDIYGDIYMRVGSNVGPKEPHKAQDSVDRLLEAALAQADALTLRANVWDSVALSLEAQPTDGQSADDLALATNAALAFMKKSIDPEDVQLSAYADLARVGTTEGQLQVNVALPTDKLVEQMNALCERKRESRERRAEPENEDEAAEDATPESAETGEAE